MDSYMIVVASSSSEIPGTPAPRQPRAFWRGSIVPMLGIFAVLFGIGLAVVLTCPPLWRDNDGLIEITSRPNDMTILHYPPAYPLFSRMHVWAAEIVQGWVQHRKVFISLRRVVVLNDMGLHLLMISQQFWLALALTVVVACGAQSRGARWSMVCILASNASLFIIANLISTEALAEPLLIALVAIGVWLFRTQKLSVAGIVAYALCFFAAIMTRHANEVFAMILPLAFILLLALEWIRTRRAPVGLVKRIAVFIVVGVICIAAKQGTTRLLCHVYQVEYRGISARAKSERLWFVKRMPPSEREAFLQGLEASSDDPVVKEAIPLLTERATWVEQRQTIEKILRRQSPEMEEEPARVKAEAYLEVITTLFFHTRSPYLVQGTLRSIWHSLSAATPTDVAEYFLKNGAMSLDLYTSQPQYIKKTHGLQVCSPAAQARIVAFEANPWLRVWQWAPHGLVLLIGSALALLFLVRKTGDPAIPLFALSMAFTALTATCLTFVIMDYHPRFTALADLFAFLSLALVVGHWFDARRRSGERPAT